MKQIFERPIPVGLFAIVILLACGLFAISFYRQGDHFKRMDAFMAAGGRFTGEDGEKHNTRLQILEARDQSFENRIDDLEVRLALIAKEIEYE